MAATITSLAGGTRGNGAPATACVSAATVTAAVASGDWLVAVAALAPSATNISGFSAFTDSSANTWTTRASIFLSSGGVLAIGTAPVTVDITNGTVSATLLSATSTHETDQIALQVYRVRPGAGETVSFIAADATGSTGSVTSHAAATVSVTNGDIIFGCASIQTDDAVTGDSDTTNGSWAAIVTRLMDDGTDANARTCSSQSKTVNATGNQSWACTTASARNSCRSYLILRSTAGGNKTLDATTAGSYALTGTDATTRRNLPLVPDSGAYALTGTDARPFYGYALDAKTPASYALTGTDTPTTHQWKVDATIPASYVLTGTDAGLNKGQTLGVDSGSYALTGTDASLRRNLPMVADAGSYLLTGTDATTRMGFKVVADPGSYLLTGTDVALTLASNKVIAAEVGSYALTGTDVTLTLLSNNKTIVADAGSYTLTGTDASTTHQWKLDATTAGSYSLAGQVADTLHKYRLDATTAGAYGLIGTDANVLHGFRAIDSVGGSYSLTGTDAGTLHRWVLDATAPGSYALTGTDATPVIRSDKFIVAAPGDYLLVGTDVTLTKTSAAAFSIVADAGSYSLTGATAATLHTWRIAAGDEGFLLNELGDPLLDEFGNPIQLEGPIGGTYALVGTDATLTKSAAAAFTLTADPGSYLLTGTPVTLISSAQPALPTRGEWPEKERRRRLRKRPEVTAREGLRVALDRLYDGGEYDAPAEALEEAATKARAVVNVLTKLPNIPLIEVRAAEDLIRSIQEMLRQRALEEEQALNDVALEIARQHLVDTIIIADEVYRRTRQNYLIKTLLLIAE